MSGKVLHVQVTRVPPVCALHAEGRRWRFDAENEPHVWFWGASIDLNVSSAPCCCTPFEQ